jgi:hypothetical protein
MPGGLLLAVAMMFLVRTAVAAVDDAAEGFGASARGGNGGKELRVTRLDDDPKDPQPGSLRWAVSQKGPRIVRFSVSGNIRLKGALIVTEPRLTLDGFDAPAGGVCICDHSLTFRDTHDIIVRYLRVRRGDIDTLKMVEREGLKRPHGSNDLDCISVNDSSDLLFDHVSASWCNDEVFGIVGGRNVSIQWCIMSEPLSNPKIHPYGDNHAFGLNLSASTLSLHHSLVAHYVMRGPQFEANDVRPHRTNPRFEAINNVLFDYERSGSRYTTGIEDHPELASGSDFAFQFINNMYVHTKPNPEIEAEMKHGVISPLKVYLSGNLGPNRTDLKQDEWKLLFAGRSTPMRQAESNVQAQVSAERLFTPSTPVTTQSAQDAYELVLARAGCSNHRDVVDQRIIRDVREKKTGRVIHSQNDVGGWPKLD